MAKLTGYVGVAGLRRSLGKLPKLATVELRDAATDLASDVATQAALAMRQVGGVLGFVADTVRATRDRVPVVRMGGTTKLPATGNGWEHARRGIAGQVGSVVWGGEFGGGGRPRTERGGSTLQFSPWRGNGEGAGYALWPTVRRMSGTIHDEYDAALGRALTRIP